MSRSFGGDENGWIVKLSSDGDLIWSRVFNASSEDYLFSAAEVNDGYVVAGYTHQTDFFPAVYYGWLVKISVDGDLVWYRHLGGSSNDSLRSVISVDGGSGILAAGNTQSGGEGLTDGWLIKLDLGGNVIWSKTLGSSSQEFFESISAGPDGYLVTGNLNGNGWLLNFDHNDNLIWSKNLGGGSGNALRVSVAVADGYIAAGEAYSFGGGLNDGWLIKLDLDGKKVWSRTMGGANTDYFSSVASLPGGGVLAAGSTSSLASHQEGWLAWLNDDPIEGCASIIQEWSSVAVNDFPVSPQSHPISAWGLGNGSVTKSMTANPVVTEFPHEANFFWHRTSDGDTLACP